MQQQQKGEPPTMAAAKAASPPVTERSTEVTAANRDTREAAKRRKGFKASLLAGETGGFQADEPGKKSLLG